MNLIEAANEATLTEAAEICGIHRRTLYWATRKGRLHVKRRVKSRHGSPSLIVDLEEVEAFVSRVRVHLKPNGKLPNWWPGAGL